MQQAELPYKAQREHGEIRCKQPCILITLNTILLYCIENPACWPTQDQLIKLAKLYCLDLGALKVNWGSNRFTPELAGKYLTKEELWQICDSKINDF